jgi:hypothetical protein
MSGYSGLDFSTVGGELAYWLTHITQAFKGGHPGSGENGYDFGMPHGTPVYSILPGKVVGAGYYGGGGVVAVQYNPQNIIYYQHLDLNQVQVGDQIAAGQQLGLSGGQLSGGNHPATCCSGGDHIEVGINAPFGGMWNPNNVGPNANPIGLFNSLAAQYQSNNVKTGGAGGGAGGSFVGLVATTGTQSQTGHCISPFGYQICIPNTIWNWITQPIRLAKISAGVLLILTGAALFMFAGAGAPYTGAAVTALSGAPEAAPAVFSAIRSVTHRRQPGEPRQAPAPAGQTVPYAVTTVQRSYTTRRLKAQMQPGTGYSIPQRPATAAPAAPPMAAPPTTPIDQQTPPAGRLGTSPNPMTAEEIAKAQGKPPPGIASFLGKYPAPKIQRGPQTGLGQNTYAYGARRALSQEPIPDAEYLQTKEDIAKFMAFQEHTKQMERDKKESAGLTYGDVRKALGLDKPGQKVPGTERTLASEQEHLTTLQQILNEETDMRVRAGIERDIAATQASIKKMRGGK